LSAHLIFILMS